MMTRIPFVLTFTVVASACGGNHFDVETPATFIELEEESSSYDYRATSAKGVVMAVREIENEPYGDRAFWVEAVRNHVRLKGGYALLDEKEVSAKGHEGTQLQFGRDQDGRPYQYWVTVFVTEERIFVIEMGGKEELFEKEMKSLEKTVASLDLG